MVVAELIATTRRLVSAQLPVPSTPRVFQRRLRAALLATGILFVPSAAYALPNPLVLFFVGDLLIQLLLVVLLVIPAGLEVVRTRIVRWLPRESHRLLVGAALFGVVPGSVAALGLGTTSSIASAPQDAAECRPLSPEVAARLGLPAGSYVLDPRPHWAFNAYHLLGSCNVSGTELVDNPEWAARLRGGGPTYLTADEELRVDTLFPDGVPSQLSGVEFRSIENGLRRYYKKEREHSSRGSGFGPAPTEVVDAAGRPVSVQLGPVWFMGFFASVFGDEATWRQLPEAAVADALLSGRPVVDLRHRQPEVPGILHVREWEAHLSDVEARLRRPLDGGVLICELAAACLLAESLAFELQKRGGAVSGLVNTRRANADLADLRPLGPKTSTWLLATLLLGGVIVAPALAWLVVAAARRMRPGGLEPVADALESARNAIAILVPFVLLAMWSPPFTSGSSQSLATVFVFDVWLSGYGATLGLLPLLFVGWVLINERALGHRSTAVRWSSVAAPVLGLFAGMSPQTFPLWMVLVPASMVVGIALHAPVERFLSSRRAPGASDPLLLGLDAAAKLDSSGGKIRGLAAASGAGFKVPASQVIWLPSVPTDPQITELARVLERRLGSGPWVVRSSAPDEDDTAPTPGRYESATGVTRETFPEGLQKVLDSYGEHRRRGVAVLVQRQVLADWAGVAVREPLGRGGGVLVEASRDDNVAVTEGRGASKRDRLGQLSKGWLGGQLRNAELPDRVFRRWFSNLEALAGGPLDVEWARVRGSLVVLQQRPAPDRQKDEHENGAAAAMRRLSPTLRYYRGRDEQVVLSRDAFSDFLPGASRVTIELLEALWHDRGPRGRAWRRLFPGTSALLPKPAVVPIDGALYANQLPARPFRAAFAAALMRVERRLVRLRAKRRIERSKSALRRLESSVGGESVPGSGAARFLELRRRFLEEPGDVALEVGLLQAALGASVEDAADADPLLVWLTSGADTPVPPNLRWRAHPDLALETPRLGEHEAGWQRVVSSPVHTEQGASVAEDVAALRARVRILAATYAVQLRQSLLELDRPDAFELGVEDLEALRAGKKVPPKESSPPASERVPGSVTLRQLELWTAEGVAPDPNDRRDRGTWIGNARRLEETVVATSTLDDETRAPGIVVLDVPTVDDVVSARADDVLLAAGGNALCHPALVARQRGLSALFGAGGGVFSLQAGQRVRIQPNGRWQPVKLE